LNFLPCVLSDDCLLHLRVCLDGGEDEGPHRHVARHQSTNSNLNNNNKALIKFKLSFTTQFCLEETKLYWNQRKSVHVTIEISLNVKTSTKLSKSETLLNKVNTYKYFYSISSIFFYIWHANNNVLSCFDNSLLCENVIQEKTNILFKWYSDRYADRKKNINCKIKIVFHILTGTVICFATNNTN
jgi:hypothetical protein